MRSPSLIHNRAGWASPWERWMEIQVSDVCCTKWLLRFSPKDHILWFYFEMGFVFWAAVLEWQAESPWTWPVKSLCFVCAPVSLIPINIPALSGQRTRVPHRGSQTCTPSPISSTFRTQAVIFTNMYKWVQLALMWENSRGTDGGSREHTTELSQVSPGYQCF